MFRVEGRKATFAGHLAVHSAPTAISIAAEAQQFPGAQVVVPESPLRLVLDSQAFVWDSAQ